jgi:hypothetical protein
MSTDGTFYRCKHCYEKSEIPFSHVVCKKSPSGFHEWVKKSEGAWIGWLIGLALVVTLSLTLLLGPPVTLANSFGLTSLAACIIAAIIVYGLVIVHYVQRKKVPSKWATSLLWSFAALDVSLAVRYVYYVADQSNSFMEELFGIMFAGFFSFGGTADVVLQVLLLAWVVAAVMGLVAAFVRSKESKALRLGSIAGAGVLSIAAIVLLAITITPETGTGFGETLSQEGEDSAMYEGNQEQGVGSDGTNSSELPDGFEQMLRQKKLFAVDFEDLVIESAELNTGWWEISVHNGNNAKYGGDSEVMPRLGTYRYYPPTGMLQYYEVSDDTWYDWTDEGTEELGDNELSEGEDKSVRSFVMDFARASNANDVDALMEFYAASVDYYSWGDSPKSKIRGDKEKYFKRWPVREYSVRRDDISITIGDMGGVYYVSFVMDYSVSHPADNRKSSGKSNVEMTIETKDNQSNTVTDLWITRERSE